MYKKIAAISVVLLLGTAAGFAFTDHQSEQKAAKAPVKVGGHDLGIVDPVVDGKTFIITSLNGKTRFTAHLSGIAVPASNQPGGSEAQYALVGLVFGRQVAYDVTAIGEDQTPYLTVHVDGADVAAELVRQGWARAESTAPAALLALEKDARSNKVGQWAEHEQPAQAQAEPEIQAVPQTN